MQVKVCNVKWGHTVVHTVSLTVFRMLGKRAAVDWLVVLLATRTETERCWIDTHWAQIGSEERLHRRQRCLRLGEEVAVSSPAESKQRGYLCASCWGSDGRSRLCFHPGKSVQTQWHEWFWNLFLLTRASEVPRLVFALPGLAYEFILFQSWNELIIGQVACMSTGHQCNDEYTLFSSPLLTDTYLLMHCSLLTYHFAYKSGVSLTGCDSLILKCSPFPLLFIFRLHFI